MVVLSVCVLIDTFQFMEWKSTNVIKVLPNFLYTWIKRADSISRADISD
jgi:hypothetical protein